MVFYFKWYLLMSALKLLFMETFSFEWNKPLKLERTNCQEPTRKCFFAFYRSLFSMVYADVWTNYVCEWEVITLIFRCRKQELCSKWRGHLHQQPVGQKQIFFWEFARAGNIAKLQQKLQTCWSAKIFCKHHFTDGFTTFLSPSISLLDTQNPQVVVLSQGFLCNQQLILDPTKRQQWT